MIVEYTSTEELKERQSWTLEQKIDHSLGAIDQFYQRLDGKVYVSFSGGKDSTVLYWLARKIYPDIKAVFCNTGNEYPDIVKFVNQMKGDGCNIEIIHPKLKPQEVMEQKGFPLVGKQQSRFIYQARNTKSEFLRNIRLNGVKGKTYNTTFGKISDKWQYLVYEPYETSERCCDELKKKPFNEYRRKNKVFPIFGTMAEESQIRKRSFIHRGSCNIFDGKDSSSMPMGIWLEQDVLDCIEKYNIPISDIYRKGAKRTGCMFCGYGCQFKDDNRLQLVYDLYPKWYNHFMNYTNNGVTYREALRKVLAVNGLHLPDEQS